MFKKLKSLFSKTKRVTNPVEDWSCFKRYSQDGYWLVVANQALMKDSKTVSLCWASVEYRFLQRHLVNKQMPTPEVFDQILSFEDRLEQELHSVSGKLAASQTGFGSRISLFFSQNLKLEEKIREIAETFEGFPIEVSTASFKQFEHLMPTHVERLLAASNRILVRIGDEGDDGTKERTVMYWAYADGNLFYQELQVALENNGYEVLEASSEVVRFSRPTYLSFDIVFDETILLVELCANHGAIYDGWETPVVRPTLQ
jgi:hypothetical protein